MRSAVALMVLVAALLVPARSAFAATYAPPDLRARVDLNTGWKFNEGDAAGAEQPGFNDAGWSSVTTPHTWNAADAADGGNNYYRGIGWYRRHHTAPRTYARKQLHLQVPA